MSDAKPSRAELEQELEELRMRVSAYEAGAPPITSPIQSGQINATTAQALLRSSPAAIIVLDHEGRVMLWNRAAEELFGWREDEVLGRPNPIVPAEAVDEFQQLFERELRGESTSVQVRRRQRRDGTPLEVRVATAPLRDDEGESIGVIGVITAADGASPAPEKSGELRQLLDTVQDGVWMADSEGLTTFVNQQMAHMLGYRPEEMIGRPAAEFLADAEAEIARQQMERRRAGIAEGYELWIPRKTDDGIWVYVSAAPIVDREGECAGSIAMVTDITARKQAEQALEQRVQQRTAELTEANQRLQEQIEARKQAEHALRESEARFRLLAENATDLICRHAPDGRYLYVSPASRKLLGYEPEELLDRSPYEFFHPDDVKQIQASHEQVIHWLEARRIEYRFRRKDGSYIWFETVARAIREPESGQVVELHTTSRDVTSRREAIEQLRLVQSAIDQVDEMVVITDTELDPPGPRIEYVNPAFCRVTGYGVDEVRGQTPRILQGPRTDRAVLDRLRDQLSRGESFEGETFNYRKDGSEFILHWHIAPVRDAQGRLTHFVSIQRDVTEQRQAEALARQRQSELAHVGRLSTMGEMASGMAHELNQPLAAIAIYVQGCLRRIQQQDMNESELIEALTHVHNQAQRASEIIRRLRDFVRKRESQRTPADANHLVREVLGLVEADILRHSARVRLELDEHVPEVFVDSVQIEQVILNLIRNALESMDANAPDDRPLTIRTHRCDDGRVCITVRDAGAGMTDEQLDRIFEPFYTTKSTGMGMGLNISQSIAQANEGRLWAERNPDRGMTFHLALPPVP